MLDTPTLAKKPLAVTPRGSWVLIEEHKIKTNLEIAGSAAPKEYVVVEAGPGRWVGETFTALPIYPGQKILFDDRFQCPTIRTDKRVLLMVPEDAILATYEGDREF